MVRRAASRLAGFFLPAATVLAATPAWAEVERWGINMPEGVTEVSHQIFDLHMTIFWICVAIGVVVFGVMFYSIFAHRKSDHRQPATFHENVKLEVLWTVIPFFILVGMAWPATTTLKNIYDTSESEVDIKITGWQWKWHYDYLGEEVAYFSNLATDSEEIYNQVEKGDHYLLEVDEPLVLPAGKKIRFLVTANDVIHSWWVPALAVKRDAVPGFIREAWTRIDEPGIYRGQCAELCGAKHGYMPIVVKVVPEQEFNTWLADRREQAAKQKALSGKTFTLDELLARGEKVYAAACVACHGAEGQGGVGPALKGSAIATGDITAHMDMVINGSSQNPMMTAFRSQLSEVDIAAVITYERNAWGNDTGDMVQPVDVLKHKNN